MKNSKVERVREQRRNARGVGMRLRGIPFICSSCMHFRTEEGTFGWCELLCNATFHDSRCCPDVEIPV